MSVKNATKPLLAKKERKDLLRFVRKEIVDLQKDEAVEEVTAELVVENLIARYPENTYTPEPKKHTTIKWKGHQKTYVSQHPL
tara:strand:- start:1414 stop:1662 length:249 start_codon:yes stop_codon:yes gene_type:complete